ncbi:hypothetical protein DLREEDagrD3_27570 [Denitratisoma sp. agr-D3]
MGSGILGIAVSGLNAAQVGIQTASHNITNSSVTGYNRQTIIQTTNTPNFTGSGFLGTGTNVDTVKRVYNDFLYTQILGAQTNVAQLQTYSDQISQIDNVLADSTAGLSPGFDNFYSALQALGSSPSSVPARQAVLSSAQALVARFQSLDQQLSTMRNGVNSQITTEVGTINSLVQQVADINQRIILAQAAGTGQPANDLLDRRDALMTELNKEVRITKQLESDGTYSVFFGNGQPLVAGTQVYQLKAVPSNEDMSDLGVALVSPNGNEIPLPENLISGGNLSGLLEFRSQTLNTAQNQLGRIAIGFTSAFNAQHQLGQDLTGKLGSDFFKSVSPQVMGAASNLGVSTVSANITVSDYQVKYTGTGYAVTRLSDGTDMGTFNSLPQSVDGVTISLSAGKPAAGDTFLIQPSKEPGKRVSTYATNTGNATLDSSASNIQSLTDSDYRLTFNGDGVTLIRLSDNQTWSATGTDQASALKTLMANTGPQGFTLSINGTAQPGDTFLIRPTRYAARDMGLLITNTDSIAAATPMRTSTTTGNSGTGTISSGEVTSTGVGLTANLKLTYDAAANALVGFPIGAQVKVGGTIYSISSATQRVPFQAGATITVQGTNFQIANTPANGDTFVVGPDKITTGNSTNPMIKVEYASGNVASTKTLTYSTATQSLSGFPAGSKVTIKDFASPPNVLGVVTIDSVGSTQIPQPPMTLPTTGVSLSYEGVTVDISGQMVNGQQITPSAYNVETPVSLPTSPITLTYKKADTSGLPARLTGFPVGTTVTVTKADGSMKTYPMDPTVAGADYVPYTAGATISFNGMSFQIGGSPVEGDSFTVGPNPSGSGDNRNLLSLEALQTANTMLSGTASFQGAYSQMVSQVGNKAREVSVTLTAQENLVSQGETAIQSMSGVNLDEEAADLIRFQQAYQASAKIIDITGKLFDMLASLGG